jgi:hypothetical protein
LGSVKNKFWSYSWFFSGYLLLSPIFQHGGLMIIWKKLLFEDTTMLKYFFIFADTIYFAWIFVKSILSRVFKLELPSFLGSSSIYQRWIAENLAVIGPMEVFECVNENFQNNYEFWKGAKMLARGCLSKKIFLPILCSGYP